MLKNTIKTLRLMLSMMLLGFVFGNPTIANGSELPVSDSGLFECSNSGMVYDFSGTDCGIAIHTDQGEWFRVEDMLSNVILEDSMRIKFGYTMSPTYDTSCWMPSILVGCVEEISDTSNCEVGYGYYAFPDDTLSDMYHVHLYSEPWEGIVSWKWYLNHDFISSDSVPVLHLQSGRYSICLQVEYANGCYAEHCDGLVIGGTEPCEADFEYTQISSDSSTYDTIASYFVEFTNTSSGNYDDLYWVIYDKYHIDTLFGTQNPVYGFDQPGKYEVALHIYSSDCFDVITKKIKVKGDTTPSCWVDINYQKIYNDDNIYQFDFYSSDYVSSVVWTIGADTIFSSDSSLIYDFPESGEYRVCVDITTINGCSASNCTYIYVDDSSSSNCQASFTWNEVSCDSIYGDSIQNCGPRVLQFWDTSIGEPDFWIWFVRGENYLDSIGGVQNPVIEFPKEGEYIVELHIANYNCQSVTERNVVIGDSGSNCYAAFEYYSVIDSTGAYDTMSVSEYIQFINYSYPDSAFYYWEFGDGLYSHEKDPKHYYEQPGTYKVCLSIRSSEGCSDTYCDYVTVYGGENCKADFSYCIYHVDSLENDDKHIIGFKNESTGSEDLYYYWNFGDGSYSYEKNPVHVYDEPGYYSVELTVSSQYGCYDYIYKYVKVGFKCEVDFEYSIAIPDCYGFEYAYGFKPLFDEGKYPQQIYWDFGDGTYSWEEEPYHIYEDFGVYNVCLEVYYDDTCMATICHEVHNLYYEVNEQFKLKCGTTLSTDKVEILTSDPAYPNPAITHVTIPVSAGLEQTVQVEIINVLGKQTVYTDNYSLQTGSNTLEINVENLQAGSYMYLISTSERVLRGNFTVIR